MSGILKRDKKYLQSLSEQDIQKRLYGGVGLQLNPAKDSKKQSSSKPVKTEDELQQDKQIQEELRKLKKELENTKRKLYQIKGRKAKTSRTLIKFSIAAVIVLLLGTIIFIFSRPKAPGPGVEEAQQLKIPPVSSVSAETEYTIQTAVYDKEADALRFKDSLLEKGFSAFVFSGASSSGSKDTGSILVGSRTHQTRKRRSTD